MNRRLNRLRNSQTLEASRSFLSLTLVYVWSGFWRTAVIFLGAGYYGMMGALSAVLLVTAPFAFKAWRNEQRKERLAAMGGDQKTWANQARGICRWIELQKRGGEKKE